MLTNYIDIYIFIIIVTIIILYLKNYDLRLDDHIGVIIADNIPIFKHIHPNIITTLGILLNFYIYQLFNYSNLDNNGSILFLCLFIRWLTDLIDGAVARKYNKGTKLGHYLDTFSDTMFCVIILNFMLRTVIGLSFYLSLIINSILILYLFLKYNILESHKYLKKNRKGFFGYIVALFTNNTYIHFVISFLLYL